LIAPEALIWDGPTPADEPPKALFRRSTAAAAGLTDVREEGQADHENDLEDRRNCPPDDV
jgi:hypothetical protein